MLKRWMILWLSCIGVWGMVWARGDATSPFSSSWATGFHLVGINGVVHSLALDTGQSFYVGGAFTTAGPTPAHNIVYWDGTGWQPVGSGLNGPVYSIAVGPDGDVYASGSFTMTGSVPVNHLAWWDGQQWLPLGTGVDLPHTILETDEAGLLYAAGDFTTIGGVPAQQIARWDGLAWAALGSGIVGTIHAVKSDGAGNLYVGGQFAEAGGVPVQNIARWDGANWSAVGAGVNEMVRAIVPWGGHRLYVYTDSFLYEWDGFNWLSYPHPAHFHQLNLPLAGNQAGDLYAIGTFLEWDGGPSGPYLVNRVIRWDGDQWDSVSADVWLVHVMAVDEQNIVTIGGQIPFAGTIAVNNVAQGWGGVHLQGLGGGQGVNYPIRALALDSSGALYAGGEFSAAGPERGRALARWNGESWTGWEQLAGFYANSVAAAENGMVYAGGAFWMDDIVYSIVVWNGEQWSGLPDTVNAEPSALALDREGNLYAVGPFTTAGGAPVNHVARWDGQTWSALAGGVDGEVTVLAVGRQGDLYVGGKLQINGQAERVARWDGTNWVVIPRPQQADNGVLHLSLDHNDRLYAAFAPLCPDCSPNEYRLARWDGSTWADLTGNLAYGYILTVTFDCSGQLYAGGHFATTGNHPANNVARWQQGGWAALGEGVEGAHVAALLFNQASNTLYVGGDFVSAGNSLSSHFAIWSAEPCQHFYIPLLLNR